jgi:hypothetical protein
LAEAFQTATLAEIYAQQGHLERACAIYEALLAAGPGDAEPLRRRLAELRGRLAEAAPRTRLQRRAARLKQLLERVRSRRRALP